MSLGAVVGKAMPVLGIALCLALCLPADGRAKETDSFTNRYEALAFPAGEVDGIPVSDFTGDFNDQFQGVFSQVLAQLNEENRRSGQSCGSDRSRRRLFQRMSNGLGGPILAGNRLRPAITHHANRFQPVMSNSIYRDFAPWRSISLGLAAKLGHKLATLFRFDLARVLVDHGGGVARAPDGRLAVLGQRGMATSTVYRLRHTEPKVLEHAGGTYHLLDNGQALVESAGRVRLVTPILVSSDKFSHFFNRSLGLFKRLEGDTERSFDRMLARNLWLEASLFGSKSTGVAAYSDLVANFQGMRFWIHLLGQSVDGLPLADPLAEEGVAPLVECSSEGRWRQTRAVDIRDYLDAAWDEALNCNRMRSRVLLDQVLRQIEALGREDPLGRAYDCPIDAGLITEAAAGYGRFSSRVINSEGHSSLRSERRRRAPEPPTAQR
jgi:hypothetical protein